MNCPKCRIEAMKHETYEGIEVDRCPACKGMFLEKGELKGLIAKKMGNTADTLNFSTTSDQMDGIAGHCFACNLDMVVVKGPGDVKVDVCKQCGAAFLDQGELATLQLYHP
jgi:Zn-finger nucleic acid-binding protein